MQGDRGWFVLLAVMLGAGVLPGAYARSQGGGAGRSEAPASGKNKDKSTAKSRGKRRERPDTADGKLYELFDAFDPGLSLEKASAVEVARQYQREGRGQIFPLVATVPDPEKSGVDASYDQTLDAIQRAASSEGFLPDRFYLPWPASGDDARGAKPEPEVEAEPGPVPHTKDTKDTSEDKSAAALRLPGILLFRRVVPLKYSDPLSLSPRVDLLVVFLVGELPKSGLYQQAFKQAINLACELRGDDRSSLFVLGPHFSGAALSLRVGLMEHGQRHGPNGRANSDHPLGRADGSWPPGPAVEVVSGSALDVRNREIIEFDLHEAGSAKFENTTIPADVLMGTVFKAIKQRLGENESTYIALLSESGTQWTAGATKAAIEAARDAAERDAAAKAATKAAIEGAMASYVELRAFHFPMHVAHLRARREKSKHESASDSPIPLRDRLELRLDGDRDSADDLPADSALTPYNIEIMLHDQLAEISREHFRFLGVLTTDPTDLVFIVQEARKYCPGVQIFTLGSHALFSHPDLMHDLGGVMVASTYPLTALWSRRGETFASYPAEGTYNAAITLLDRLGAAELGHPRRYKDWGDPFEPDAQKRAGGPQIWLGMVNNAAIWPFDMRSPRDPGIRGADVLVKEAGQTGTLAQRPPISDLAQGLYWLLLILTALHVHYVCASLRRRPCRPVPVERADGVAHVVVMSGALLGTWGLWATIALRLVERPEWLVWTLRILPALAALSVLVPLCWALWYLRPAFAAPIGGWRRLRIVCPPVLLLVATAAIGVGLEGSYLRRLCSASGSPAVQLALGRMVQPLSGVSPAMPLLWLALGSYLWGVAGLRRARARTRLPLLSPFPLRRGRWLEEVAKLAKDVRSAYVEVFPRLEQGIAIVVLKWCFAIVVLLVPFYFFWHELLPTFEPGSFDWLFKITFLLLVVALATEAGQLHARWRQLRHLLRRLAEQPMLDAYARVGGDSSPWFHLNGEPDVPSPDELGQAMKVVELAWSNPKSIRRLQCWLAAQADALTSLSGEPCHDVACVHAHLFRFARVLYLALNRLWKTGRVVRGRKDGQPLPLEDLTGPERSIATAEVLAARQTLALIRFGLGQLRIRMMFIAAGSLTLLFAISSYPFQPIRFAALFVWAIVLGGLGVVLWVIFGVERDRILSLTAHTRPGHIDFNFAFVSKVLVYGLPTGAMLLATAFPEVGDLLFAWLGPVMRVFHH